MNGPQHYEEAERVREALRSPLSASQEGFDGWQRDDLIALATFHATMALTAAQVESSQLAYMHWGDCATTESEAWGKTVRS